MGGRSQSSSKQTTINQDNRTAVQDGIGLSNSNGNNISVLDGGIVSRALDTVDLSLMTSNDAFTKAMQASSAATSNAIALTNANTQASLKFADGQIGKALETVDTTLGDGFGRLLDISENMFAAGGELIDRTQQTVAGAYADAQNTAKGTIDNRTLIILAVAGAAVAGVVMLRKKG